MKRNAKKMNEKACPRLYDWIALLKESLPESQTQELEDHLESCEKCRNFLSLIAEWPDDLIELLQNQTEISPEQFRKEYLKRVNDVPLIEGFDELVEIKRGGMSIIYSARQIHLNRKVAIKLLTKLWSFHNQFDKAYYRESRLLAKLNHPNIIKVFGVGVIEDQPYIIMELNDQDDLQTKIQKGPVEPKEAANIIQQIASAIHHAHEIGIVHRDIKPSNILVDSMGFPRITDFGIAKETDSQENITRTGYLLGTPKYMAPEQIDPAIGPKDHRIDIYGLGVTLYTLLTGDAPFQSTSENAILRKIVEDDPISPRKINKTISRDLETIILKCMEKNPKNRFFDAQILADELQRYLDGRPIASRPISNTEVLIRKCRKHPFTAGLGLVLMFFVLLTIAGSIMFGIKQNRLKEDATELANLAQKNMRLLMKENEQSRNLLSSLSLNMQKTSKLFVSLQLNSEFVKFQDVVRNYLDDVIPVYESYFQKRQKDLQWTQDEVIILFILSDFLDLIGKHDQSSDYREKAIVKVSFLLKKENPSNRFRLLIADSATKKLINADKGANKLQYVNLAYEVIKEVNAEDFEYPLEVYQRKSMTSYNLAKYRSEEGNYLECVKIHKQFISVLENALTKNPDDTDLTAFMVQHQCGLATAYLNLHQCELADELIQKNERLLQKLLSNPKSKYGQSPDVLKKWNEYIKDKQKNCQSMP